MFSELPDRISQYLTRAPFSRSFTANAEITVEQLPAGVWNVNHLVTIDRSRKLVFKLYPHSARGMIHNSSSSEYQTLRFLSGTGLAPSPLGFDDSRIFFDCPLMIYEYVEGETLAVDRLHIESIAVTLAQLHSLCPTDAKFLPNAQDSPERIKRRISRLLTKCNDEIDIHQAPALSEYARIAPRLLSIPTNKRVDSFRSVIHGDLVPSNIIVTASTVALIDWQTSMIGDPATDLAYFLCEPYNLWDWSVPMKTGQRNGILEHYCALTGDSEIESRVAVRQPLLLLLFGLHSMLRFADFQRGQILIEMSREREAAFYKYQTATQNVLNTLRGLIC